MVINHSLSRRSATSKIKHLYSFLSGPSVHYVAILSKLALGKISPSTLIFWRFRQNIWRLCLCSVSFTFTYIWGVSANWLNTANNLLDKPYHSDSVFVKLQITINIETAMLSTLCNRISCNSSRPQERLGQVECALWKLAGQIFFNDMENENICTMNGENKYFFGCNSISYHLPLSVNGSVSESKK